MVCIFSILFGSCLIICYICGMDIREATAIAEKYCNEHSGYRHAVYGGIFDGGHLFSLNFNGSGHHGMHLFVIVRPDASVEQLEKHSDIYFKAWHSSNDYLNGLKL